LLRDVLRLVRYPVAAEHLFFHPTQQFASRVALRLPLVDFLIRIGPKGVVAVAALSGGTGLRPPAASWVH
jgi:hypothetical protein